MKPGKKCSFVLLLMTMVFSLAIQAQHVKNSDKLRQSKSKLEDEIKYTGEMLEKTKKEKQTSLNRVKILNKQIKNRELLINTIHQQLQEVEGQMIYENEQVGRMSQKLKELRREYSKLVMQAYKTMNGRSRLMFIFSARDFNQAYQRLKYYQQFAAYRRVQAARIESTVKNLSLHLKELDATHARKMDLVTAQSNEKQKLALEKNEKDKAVKIYSSREKELLSSLKQKQLAAQKLNSEIEKAIAAEIRASEERSKPKTKTSVTSPNPKGKEIPGAKTGSSELSLTPGDVQLSSSFSANRGKLPWPCERGIISGNFGEHPHPVLKHVMVKNNGVDIMTNEGSNIRTVFGGKVSKVMSFQYLNKVVIIRHGEFLTVYSNLGDINVREGEEVKAKQVIGKIHNSPDDQRPELHFELWKGKSILNPELWLVNR